MAMVFEDVDGHPIPTLLDNGNDKGFYDLEAAQTHFRLSRESLERVYGTMIGGIASSLRDKALLEDVGAAPAPAPSGAEVDTIPSDELLHRWFFSDLSVEQFKYFLRFCRERGINPWYRQVFAHVEADLITGMPKVIPLLTIGGHWAVAHRTRETAGMDEAKIEYTDDSIFPVKAVVTVYRKRKGEKKHGYAGRALWAEFYGTDPDALHPIVARYPSRCLEKCAEAQALRKAFPELDGFYSVEEFSRPKSPTRQPAPVVSEPPPEEDTNLRIVPDDTPETPEQFDRSLQGLGLKSMGMRRFVFNQFNGWWPGLLERSPQLFFAKALAAIHKQPNRYGVSARPTQAAAMA